MLTSSHQCYSQGCQSIFQRESLCSCIHLTKIKLRIRNNLTENRDTYPKQFEESDRSIECRSKYTAVIYILSKKHKSK